jgi:MFS family permease
MKSKKYFGINVNVVLLSIVSFLNDMSSEMVLPILPLFINSLGGTGIIIGLVGGLRESLAGFLKIISGYWSDRIGKRKIFVVNGYLVSVIFKVFLGLSRTWKHVLIFSSLGRSGKGLRDAPRDAIIADFAKRRRGKVFGFHRTFDTAGAILGSIIVLVLLRTWELDFRSIIFIAALIGFFALFPLNLVSEKKYEKKRISFKLSFFNLPRKLKLFMMISGVFALANFSYMFFILKAQEIIGGTANVEKTILLYIIYNIFYALFAIPLGILADKIGRKKVILFGYFLFALTCVGFLFFHSLFALVLLFVFYGITYAFIEGNQRAYIVDLAADYIRATALGAFHTITSILTFASSLFAGILWQISSDYTFIYGAVMSLCSLFLFFLFKNKFVAKRHIPEAKAILKS